MVTCTESRLKSHRGQRGQKCQDESENIGGQEGFLNVALTKANSGLLLMNVFLGPTN